MTPLYQTTHPTLGPCGHRHETLGAAAACLKKRRFHTDWTCPKCGVTVQGSRRGVRRCKDERCMVEVIGKTGETEHRGRRMIAAGADSSAHSLHRSDDEGATWQPMTNDDWQDYIAWDEGLRKKLEYRTTVAVGEA